jgi:hypothetical protein
MAQLLNQPHWHAATQILINGCAGLPSLDERVSFLDRVCSALGNQLYPAFLQLLYMVNTQADTQAQQAVAHTLAHALSTGRIPSGRLGAWGGTAQDHGRSLGPIEYLCAWQAQQTGSQPLSVVAFDRAATAVVALVSCDKQAQQLYCAKLEQDISDPLGGCLTRSTRTGLAALVRAWERGACPQTVVQSWFSAMPSNPWAALGPSPHGRFTALQNPKQ